MKQHRYTIINTLNVHFICMEDISRHWYCIGESVALFIFVWFNKHWCVCTGDSLFCVQIIIVKSLMEYRITWARTTNTAVTSVVHTLIRIYQWAAIVLNIRLDFHYTPSILHRVCFVYIDNFIMDTIIVLIQSTNISPSKQCIDN